MDFSSRRRPDLVTFPEPAGPAFCIAAPAAPPAGVPLRHLQAALNALPHLVWMGDSAGEEAFGNSAWQEFTGCTHADGWLQWVHPEDRSGAAQLWQQSLRSGDVFQGEYRLHHHSGSYRWLLVEARFQKDTAQNTGHWYLTASDIHARVLAQQELAASVGVQRNMLDVSVDCIKMLRTDGTLIHMNQSGCNALGVAPDSGFGQRWLPLLPEEVRDKGQHALQKAVQGEIARFAGMSVVPGHKPMYWDNILTPVKNSQGQTTSILCVSRDVTLQREAENRLRVTSECDALTGLPNRRAFNRRLQRVLAATRDTGRHVGLMLLDLDHFKHVNDTLGHAAGDHLLRVLSRRLQRCLPAHGFVARLGGDEFAVLLGPLESEADLDAVAQRVLAQIHAPITYSGKPINGGLSMGCALFPHDARDASSLMKCADTALNDLKAGGRGGVRRFGARMQLAAEQVAAQLALARRIVRDDAITPHYQPKVALEDGRVVGFEALMRWRDGEGSFQAPAPVLAAFKDYELATRIGETMRSKVLTDMAAWLQAGLPVLPVALNAAPVEFLRDDYADRLLAQLRARALPTSLIEIEVTEHILGERGSEYVVRALRQLKAAGVRIALDDFGTGHSSLAHLRDYPVDCLKIDCDFVRRIGEDPTILAIVQAVGQLGPSLSLDIVAEGIETEQQRRMLIDAGYRIGQGYLFGKAGSAAEVVGRLQQRSAQNLPAG